MTYKCINFDRQDGVAHIELNRPDKANAIDPTLSGELYEVAKLCSNDAETRAVLLSGAGPLLLSERRFPLPWKIWCSTSTRRLSFCLL
jgi:enoyl-CoA hydratase/carnithine racemase